jgi:hypothetical protein
MLTRLNIKNDSPKVMLLPRDPNLDMINQIYIKHLQLTCIYEHFQIFSY